MRAPTYNDDNRMTSITYSGVTDLYYYQYTGLRYRARLAGTYYRYLYDGERVLEELNDSGTMTARYTAEDDSYFGQWLHLYRLTGALSRFPMGACPERSRGDNIGTARGLLDASGTATDWYELDTFGRQVSSSGTTPNPYRYGGAWGYITDPSGLEQLGERFYWPELGRFVTQDPIGDGDNWYAYSNGSPVINADPKGTAARRRKEERACKPFRRPKRCPPGLFFQDKFICEACAFEKSEKCKKKTSGYPWEKNAKCKTYLDALHKCCELPDDNRAGQRKCINGVPMPK